MFRAGKSIFEKVCWRTPVAIVAGKGNNAGDGYVVAKLLKDSDIDCRIFLIDEDRFS
ncbi:MAG: NAD(P)H-hydrate epimerase, partial [Bacillota bacterium]|nr:NAD(P)H-hydrate epimerase [Bacillota bacterium]